MRKVYLFNFITLDGYFEGKNRDINWHNTDEEFNQFSVEQLSQVGTLLFGRITYELMASYWATDQAQQDDPETTKMMNSLPKVVFSRKLQTADWQNSRVVSSDAAAEVRSLKESEGKDIAIFGSGNLAHTLIEAGVVDELRIMVNPILLGEGTPVFAKGTQHKLELINSRQFKNGNVLLSYRFTNHAK